MWVWQWKCHDYLWELIPSKKYPDRNKFQPICPVCNTKPKREWAKINAAVVK